MIKRWTWVPFGLVYLRLFLTVPVILILVWQLPEIWLLVCLIIGLISDIFDGILARRLGVATVNLRRADTIVDTVFFSTMVIAAWITHPTLFQKYLLGIMLLISIKLVRIVFDYLKFGREAAYHMWSTKLWGITVFLALAMLWLDVQSALFFQIALLLGIVTNLEGLCASIILPTWQHDVPSLYHARKLIEAEGIMTDHEDA